jgi:hypothetical protein
MPIIPDTPVVRPVTTNPLSPLATPTHNIDQFTNKELIYIRLLLASELTEQTPQTTQYNFTHSLIARINLIIGKRA